MRITADQGRCLGAGQCVLSAPDHFDQSELGLVVVLDPEVPDGEEERFRVILGLCPSQALSLEV